MSYQAIEFSFIFENLCDISSAFIYISDPNDIPHLAACLASKADGIWAHDPHFLEQQKVKVFTNIDMLKLSGKAKSD